MNAYMLDGLGSSSIGSNQEQLPLLQGLLGSTAWTRAEPSIAVRDLRITNKEVDAAVLADPRSSASPRTVGSENKRLAFLDRMTTPPIAGLTTGDQVFGGIVELVTVKMICHEIVATRPPSHAPGNRPSAPVARVRSGTNRTVKHFAVLQDPPPSRGQRMSLLAKNRAVSRF